MELPAHLSPAERATLTRFVAEVRQLLGEALLDLRLYGSRARGEGHAESDLDVAVVVAEGGRAHRRAIIDLAFDLMLEHGPRIEPLVIEQSQLDELRRRERLFARELDRDGIAL